MAEGRTPAEFERWVEPHLTSLARFAARRVGPAERDLVVQQALIRAWQRWPTYDAGRCTQAAWLLGIVADQPARDRARQPTRDVVELVDHAGTPPPTRDTDLERAVEGLGGRERLAVDLHYFAGLDLATVAEVVHGPPATVEATLDQARRRAAWLLGDDVDRMDRRLATAAERWQAEQPPPPEVPWGRLDERLRRHVPWPRAVAVTAVVLLLVGGAVAVVTGLGRDGDGTPAQAAASPPPSVHHATQTVPFRDLPAVHPVLGRERERRPGHAVRRRLGHR